MMNEKWFSLGIDEIEKKLKTNAASGLSRKAARLRGNRGAGNLFYVSYKSPWWLFFEIFSDFSLIILFLGAVFSLFFETEEYIRGVTVLVIIVCNITFCTIMYFRTQRMIESMSSFFYPTARVVRNGRLFHTDFRSVVVGDVILLEPGDVLCCDARLVSSENLRVKMRVDKDNYILLEKDARAHVNPREQRAKELSNMLHAGSIIETGNARAIVTAVGKYTYLGAMTGGIPLPQIDNNPLVLKKMRKNFSKINIIMLIAVLPFSVISLLMGNMISGHDAVLSVSFLTAISIAATAMSQLICTMFKLYYAAKIKRLLLGRNSAVLKSADALDKFATVDYIFMLDGCAVTDGFLHFNSAVCSEGEIRNYKTLNKTAERFVEYVYLYYSAATQMLTTGPSRSEAHFFGIQEFVKKSGIDIGALKIRCSILSYTSGDLTSISEKVCFTDRGEKLYLKVSCSANAFRACRFAMLGGKKQPLSKEGIINFESQYKKYVTLGLTPVVFSVSTDPADSDACFLGMIILKEGYDENFAQNVSSLAKFGCKVISFVSPESNPKFPSIVAQNGCVAKQAFLRNNLPITYSFGSINSYMGFDASDISNLVSYVHSQGRKVAIVGLSEKSAKIAEGADVFITCSEIYPHISGRLHEEIQVAEFSDWVAGTACIQTVKEKADCLIIRPKNGRGGLASLVDIFGSVKAIYNNISDFIRHMISVNLMNLIVVALPLLFGDAILDARHVMLCSYALNMFAFFAFMLRKRAVLNNEKKNYCAVDVIKGYFIGDKAMILPSIISSLSAVILPIVLDFIIGGYDYKLEVLFTSLVLLHFTSFALIYYANDFSEIKYFFRNKLLLVEFGVIVLLLTLCFSFDGFGALFGVEGWMGLPYFVISLTPMVIYAIVFIAFNLKKQKINF